MPQTSFRDSQNPWFSNQQPSAAPSPAPGTGGSGLPATAWQGLGQGISNVRDGGDLRKWLDPKNYQNWTRDQWRAAMQFGTYNGSNFMGELENLIGTHAMNQHKNYFNASGQGYLPGHFDYNTGKMVYNGIDPNLVTEVNNRPFNWSNGSTSGATIGPNGQLGQIMNTGLPQQNVAPRQRLGDVFQPDTNGVIPSFANNTNTQPWLANVGQPGYNPTAIESPRYRTSNVSPVQAPTVNGMATGNAGSTLPTLQQGNRNVRQRPYFFQPQNGS